MRSCRAGRPAEHGEYNLADDTYRELLDTLEKRPDRDIPAPLRQNVLAFYGAAPASREDHKHWTSVQRALAALGHPAAKAASRTSR